MVLILIFVFFFFFFFLQSAIFFCFLDSMVDLCNLLVFFYLGSFAIYWVSISMVDFGFLRGFDFDFGLYFLLLFCNLPSSSFFFFGFYG
jgi:hypothetical protein